MLQQPAGEDSFLSAMDSVIMFKWGSKQKPFRCQVCDMAFEEGPKLREHMSKHTEAIPKKPFPCKACSKSFMSAKSLDRHALVHYGQALKRCRFCYKVFANKENLDKHVEIHNGKKPYRCPQCGDGFAFKHGLETHMVTHTGIRPFICQVCQKGFNRKDILERHMLVHTKAKDFKCVECGRAFAHIFILKRHVRTVHSKEYDGKECDLCGKFIKSKENIQRHMLTHTDERPYKCIECGKGFTQKQHVIDHMVTHTGDYPHKCSYCTKEFRYKRSLNRHLQCHELGSFTCEYPECVKVFANRPARARHMTEHMGAKRFKCALCTAFFKQRSSLKKHYERYHEGQTIYKEIGVGTDDFNDLKSQLTVTDENPETRELLNRIFDSEGNVKAGTSEHGYVKMPDTVQKEEVIVIVVENDGQKEYHNYTVTENQAIEDDNGLLQDTEETETMESLMVKEEDKDAMEERSNLIQKLIDYAEKQRNEEEMAHNEQSYQDSSHKVAEVQVENVTQISSPESL